MWVPGYCPNKNCECCKAPHGRWWIKRGSYRHKRLGRYVQRYQCRFCGRRFSARTFASDYLQHRPDVNLKLMELLCQGTPQRKAARVLNINKNTVDRKLRYLAAWCRRKLAGVVTSSYEQGVEVQFDELETFEHTKCKPLSVALAVRSGSREILGARVAEMPCKGPLAKLSRVKYGPREDHRPRARREVLRRVAFRYPGQISIRSDLHRAYPNLIGKILPNARHQASQSRRGVVVGEGRFKKRGRDRLFYINHACAYLRDNLKRLTRRTWTTTKDWHRLQDLFDIYIWYHNTILVTNVYS